MAANIFTDMVMEEAIRDKEIQVKQQMKDQEGKFIDPSNVDDILGEKDSPADNDDDDDDDLDEEEEKILRSLRERRLEEMKNEY